MTVASEINHNQYVGNGVTTSFDYQFRVFKASHLQVQTSNLDGVLTTLVLNTDYTVTGVGSVGGKVVLTAPLANGWSITIDRDLPLVQETDLRNQGTFYAETHEDTFDYLTMLIQRVYSLFGLALRRPSWLSKFYDALGNRISNLGTPVKDQDATTKQYVDQLNAGTTSGWQAGDAALGQRIDSNFARTLRVPENSIPQIPEVGRRKESILGFDSGGNPVPIYSWTATSDLAVKLASEKGPTFIGRPGGGTLQDDIDAFNPLLPPPEIGSENTKGGTFDVSELSPWGQVGFTAGGKRKATILFGRDGSVKVSVSNEQGMLTADGVMMPTVRTMFGMQSAQAIPFKLIQFPSDGFESDRKSPGMMYGCSDSGKPALFLIPPSSSTGKPANNWGDSSGYKAVTADDTYPTRKITRTGGGYYKIAEIPAGSSLNNVRGQFRVVGSWNRERLASITDLRINNFVGINWASAANYTAAQWSRFFKVLSDGALYDRTADAARVSFGLTLLNGALSVYVFLPLDFYGEISSQGTRTLTRDFVISDELSPQSAPSGLITLVRGNIFTSDNAGICSDGTIAPCDAHIRIATDSDPTKTVRELTANGYLWIGSGSSNLPLGTAVSVTHTSTGVYTINGVSGLWQSQARLRQPYDYDGNQVAIAEITGTSPVIRVYKIVYLFDSTTGTVTRAKGALMDIPASAWVDVFYSENWS